jgi:hypothetical protein
MHVLTALHCVLACSRAPSRLRQLSALACSSDSRREKRKRPAGVYSSARKVARSSGVWLTSSRRAIQGYALPSTWGGGLYMRMMLTVRGHASRVVGAKSLEFINVPFPD